VEALKAQDSRLARARAELAGILKECSARDYFTFSRLRPGVPKGAVTQIAGEAGLGKTRAVLQLLAEQPHARVGWVEDRFTAYPRAFSQLKVDLQRVLFVESGEKLEDFLWSTLQLLQSRVFEIVVAYTQLELDQVALRRLQLASEQSHAATILLSEQLTSKGAWPISLQIHTHRLIQRNGNL
jgi:hypothetical protein